MVNLQKDLAVLGLATQAPPTFDPFGVGGMGGGKKVAAHESAPLGLDQGIREWGKLFDELRLKVTPATAALDEFFKREAEIQKLASVGMDVSVLEQMNLAKYTAQIDSLADPLLTRQSGQYNADMARTLAPIVQAAPIIKSVRDEFAGLDADAYNFGRQSSDAFTKMIIYGRGLEQSLRSLIDLFAQFILKTYIFSGIAKGLGQGNSPTGDFGSFFAGLAGGRAAGGPVNYGSAYMVGESGPEIFTPTTSGMIIPNDQISGPGGKRGGDIHIDARGADAGVEYRVMRALQATQKQATVNGYLMSREMTLRGN
jgi:hypothetical protein